MSEHMMMKRVIGLGLATSIGLTACSGPSSERASKATASQIATQEAGEGGEYGFRVKTTFFSDGHMYTEVSDADHRVYGRTDSFCQGNDLREANSNDGAPVVRTENHHACDDGKLTPEDFNLSAEQIIPAPGTSVPR